ncbi:MAG: RNA methyltransferase [Desulfobacula sp.]|uniref:RNA methyltransferase n=1 Tax=Desulfobacula sp. TaxID=2593537 RepID=UPI0025BCC61F|nr:RNA methyltransferase [Desulfobacula sp.]MCD4720296.1 RNA methyltransferase [Desulfobacula sp.]
MDTFGFTKKKLLSLCHETQNKHIIIWLSKFYQKLTTNRVNQASLELFTHQYNEILNWTGMNPFIQPESNNTRLWIETISDQIHFYRSATGNTFRDYDLLEKIQTNDLSFSCHQIDFHCHVALDGLRSLFNVGSIFRTCEAAGFKSIILGNTLGKEHPGVRKTAMGAHKWVEQEKAADLAQTLLEKKEKGFQIIGVETIEGARPFYDISWKKKTIVVFGNEEYGISSHVMETCDKFIHIPMFGKKNSINVANAVSVICFHIARSLCDK